MTPKQQKIYNLICKHHKKTGKILSNVAIAEKLGFSRQEIDRQVKKLVELGYMQKVEPVYYEIVDINKECILKVPKVRDRKNYIPKPRKYVFEQINEVIQRREIKTPDNRYPKYLTLLIKDMAGIDRTRAIVRYRDNYQCQDCGAIRTPEMSKEQAKKQFDVHHLNGLCGKMSKSYDKVDSIDGLITLCHRCHFNRPEHKSNKKVINNLV